MTYERKSKSQFSVVIFIKKLLVSSYSAILLLIKLLLFSYLCHVLIKLCQINSTTMQKWDLQYQFLESCGSWSRCLKSERANGEEKWTGCSSLPIIWLSWSLPGNMAPMAGAWRYFHFSWTWKYLNVNWMSIASKVSH